MRWNMCLYPDAVLRGIHKDLGRTRLGLAIERAAPKPHIKRISEDLDTPLDLQFELEAVLGLYSHLPRSENART